GQAIGGRRHGGQVLGPEQAPDSRLVVAPAAEGRLALSHLSEGSCAGSEAQTEGGRGHDPRRTSLDWVHDCPTSGAHYCKESARLREEKAPGLPQFRIADAPNHARLIACGLGCS